MPIEDDRFDSVYFKIDRIGVWICATRARWLPLKNCATRYKSISQLWKKVFAPVVTNNNNNEMHELVGIKCRIHMWTCVATSKDCAKWQRTFDAVAYRSFAWLPVCSMTSLNNNNDPFHMLSHCCYSFVFDHQPYIGVSLGSHTLLQTHSTPDFVYSFQPSIILQYAMSTALKVHPHHGCRSSGKYSFALAMSSGISIVLYTLKTLLNAQRCMNTVYVPNIWHP